MAKIAVLSDTHWGVRNDSPVFLDYFKKCVDEFFLPTIKEQGVTHIIHMGDLVDRRKYVNINTAKRLREDFLQKLLLPTKVIGGNHDEYYKDTYSVNALDELLGNRYPNIQAVLTPQTITIDGCEIFLLPWITKDNELESYEALEKTTATICMGHLELEGFEFYRGQVSDHGWNHHIFRRFMKVYSGHYHHRSVRDNVQYIGAFSEHIWSDYNDPRGFVIFNTEDHSEEFFRNPFTIFNMIVYDDVKDTDILNTINNTDYSKYKDTFVRVVCGNKTNPYAFDMLLDKLYKETPVDISIVEDVSLFTDSSPEEVVDQTQDTPTILDSYIEGLTLPVSSDKMKVYMRDVYLEAINLETVE
mgnify:CR=1 FL=1